MSSRTPKPKKGLDSGPRVYGDDEDAPEQDKRVDAQQDKLVEDYGEIGVKLGGLEYAIDSETLIVEAEVSEPTEEEPFGPTVLKVRVAYNANEYKRGDVLLVDDSEQSRSYIAQGLFEAID